MRSLQIFGVLGLLVAAPPAQTQEAGIPNLSQEEIASHLTQWTPPIFPAIAQAAQVVGEVVLRVEIGPEGMVRSTKVVSGPPMLRQATIDSVKSWRYQPFHQGDASIAVTGNVAVTFGLDKKKPIVHTPHEPAGDGTYTTTVNVGLPEDRDGPDRAIAARFYPVWETCTGGVMTHKIDANTTTACQKAAAIADEFAPDSRYIERRGAYVYAATAFANKGDLQAALPYANKAVGVVKLGQDGASGSEAAYSTRGHIRAFLGDMEGGDADMTIAENFARKMENTFALKRDLQFHADLLNRMNRLQDVQVKLNEAAKL
jgi:TonB family protein